MVLATQVRNTTTSLFFVDQAKYAKKGKYFQCLDLSATITLDKINDDFCKTLYIIISNFLGDCKDGSDEPGTSACSNIKSTQFYCHNKGYLPKSIYTSFVNDGICDCCDGSDEYLSNVCPNTCKEQGASIRIEYETQILSIKKGLEQKKQYQATGKAEYEKIKAEHESKKQEVERLEAELKELEDKKVAAEKIEEQEREVIRAKQKQEEEAKKAEEDAKKAAEPPKEEEPPAAPAATGEQPAPEAQPTTPPVSAPPAETKDLAAEHKNEGKLRIIFVCDIYVFSVSLWHRFRDTLVNTFDTTLKWFKGTFAPTGFLLLCH